MAQTSKSTTVYLPTDVIDKVDQYAAELHARDGIPVARSAAITVLLKRALGEKDAE